MPATSCYIILPCVTQEASCQSYRWESTWRLFRVIHGWSLHQDSFRFFHRLRFDGLSMSDAEQLLNMTLMGLRQMASDPDVARSGLEILADLGKTPGVGNLGNLDTSPGESPLRNGCIIFRRPKKTVCTWLECWNHHTYFILGSLKCRCRKEQQWLVCANFHLTPPRANQFVFHPLNLDFKVPTWFWPHFSSSKCILQWLQC